jgi:hypothetical protein
MGDASRRDGTARAQASGYAPSKGDERGEHRGGVWRGHLSAARSAWGRPQKDMNTTAAHTATGPRPREGMRGNRCWKPLTSVIGLARIEWCQRQGRHESQEDHRAATRRTATRELCGRFLGPLCQHHQREKARHKRWAIYVI